MQHSRARWDDRVRRVERWLLPAECLGCGDPVTDPHDPLVCGVCRVRWQPISDPICPRCGQPNLLDIACRLCVDWPTDFGPVVSGAIFDPELRRLVHRLKYDGWQRLADVLVLPLRPRLLEWPVADLVPIPLSRGRLRSRGYNQAEVIARAVGKMMNWPVRPDRLRRSRETASQTRLGPSARLANLAEAFVATESDRSAVLVDDVFTTGATLVSAARALLDSGAVRVGGATVARAAPPLVGTRLSNILQWERGRD